MYSMHAHLSLVGYDSPSARKTGGLFEYEDGGRKASLDTLDVEAKEVINMRVWKVE